MDYLSNILSPRGHSFSAEYMGKAHRGKVHQAKVVNVVIARCLSFIFVITHQHTERKTPWPKITKYKTLSNFR